MSTLILSLIFIEVDSQEPCAFSSRESSIFKDTTESNLDMISIQLQGVSSLHSNLFYPLRSNSKNLLENYLKKNQLNYCKGPITHAQARLFLNMDKGQENFYPHACFLLNQLLADPSNSNDILTAIQFCLNHPKATLIKLNEDGSLHDFSINKDKIGESIYAPFKDDIIELQSSKKQSIHKKWNNQTYELLVVPGIVENNFILGYQKPTEEKSHKNNPDKKLFLNTISESQQVFLKEETTRKGFELLLNQLLKYTHSSFGFIGEIKTDSSNQRYLVSHAISNISWDDKSRKFYEQSYSSGLEFRNLDTLFGQTITNGKTYISNSPETDSKSSGVPNGHPKINSFIGIPFYYGDEFMGMIGLANKVGGYEASLEQAIEPILISCATLVHAHKSQQNKLQIQEELKKSKEEIESILIAMRDIVFELDEDLTISNFWTGDESLLFLPPKQLKGLKLSGIIGFPSLQELIEKCKATLASGKRETLEYFLRIKGEDIWFKAVINRIHTPEKPKRLSVLIQDNTEHKEWENKISRALEKEKELNQLKSRFIGMASHEFRGPLSCIQSSAEIMDIYLSKFENNTEKFSKHIQTIRKETEHLTGLINEILLIGKTESKSMEIKSQQINLADLIAGISNRNNYQNQFSINFTGEKRNVLSDKLHLEHILENLISNAIKYTPHGKDIPEVGIEIRANNFILTIKDYGIGIPETDKANLFQSFFRASNVGNIEGNGMGLVLVKNFVELHNGKIALETEQNKGTIFTITLPG